MQWLMKQCIISFTEGGEKGKLEGSGVVVLIEQGKTGCVCG